MAKDINETRVIDRVQQIRAKYEHLEDRAIRAFNRRLTRRHALTWKQWDAYLNRVIETEVLVNERYAQEFDAWIRGLHDEYQ